MQLTKAMVRIPGTNFAAGLTSAVGCGAPDFEVALVQHENYCEALRRCGLQVTKLAASLHHPDSTFIEDTAVMTARGAIVTRPGAPTRLGEEAATLEVLRGLFAKIYEIKAPGTVDGGDVCDADGHFIIGLSGRTNEEGARQLTTFLEDLGYAALVVDIRGSSSLLHLKSGMSYIGNGVFVVDASAPFVDELNPYELIIVPSVEAYATNCIRVNDSVVIAAGYPKLLTTLTARGYQVTALEMSEFRKMDGGLSCLSLRW